MDSLVYNEKEAAFAYKTSLQRIKHDKNTFKVNINK